jgi:Na+/melibiose symporter-like transporter
VSGAATQTDDAERAIRLAAGGLPAALFLAAAAVMLAYPLSEDRFHRIVSELTERRAAVALKDV